MVDTPLRSQETHLQSVRPVTRNFLAMSYYVQCTSMTVGYFHGKQKESRLNQENFLAFQILTYNFHISCNLKS